MDEVYETVLTRIAEARKQADSIQSRLLASMEAVVSTLGQHTRNWPKWSWCRPETPTRQWVNKLAGLPAPSGITDLKALAIARLMLDNFDHIKAFWIMITPKVAQVALSFGVDDLDGTVREEHIAHDAGAETAQYQPAEAFLRMIREAGRIPVERDTLYNVISRYDSESHYPSPATACQQP